MFILLFQGSATIVDILVLYSWYPPTKQVSPLLGGNRGQLSHSYKPLNTFLAVESTKNDKQPLTQNFETKYFRTKPINWTLTLYFKSERNVSIFVEIGACLIYTMILGILGNTQLLI